MIHRLIRWWSGYVRIALDGPQIHRFLSKCHEQNIFFWDMCWNGSGSTLYASLTREDWRRLAPVTELTRLQPQLLKECGGVFWCARALQRISFWCGIACFTVLLFFLSGRIWGIEVEGNSYHTKESILKYLEAHEIYGGIARRNVVCSRAEAAIREDFEDIGWVSIEKSGSKLYVRIREIRTPDRQRKEVPGSLIAEDAGTVQSIVTRTGTAKVRAGKKVKKGQTLISGKLTIRGDNEEVIKKYRVHAEGTVVLQCTQNYRKAITRHYQKKSYTGRRRTIYQLQAMSHSLFLYNPVKNLETYKKYDIISEGGFLCPFISLRFPLSLRLKTFREVRYTPAKYNRTQAEQILNEFYQEHLMQMKQAACYDIDGTLRITQSQDRYLSEATIRYSRVQDTYRPLQKTGSGTDQQKH